MNSITLAGIQEPNTPHDNRLVIYLTVNYKTGTIDGQDVYEDFNWFIRMPPTFDGSFGDYIALREPTIYSDIATKLQQWDNLDPKTREVPGPMGEGSTTVPITREEIVCPTYPDYYVKRASEYPALTEQFDAYWKGGADRDAMYAEIEAIKTKYPKDTYQ